MQSALDTLCRMTQVAPPGRTPAGAELDRLRRLTGQLMATQPDSHAELTRYLSVQERGIPVPEQEAGAAIRGRRVLGTGGSGCIGTELLRTLAALRPSMLLSAANTPPAHSVPGVRYLHLDVGDRRRTEECLRAIRPDVVFHLAAQRDPGRAEEEAFLAEAERGCATGDDQAVCEAFQAAAWALLEATVQTVSPAILHRITGLTAAHRPVMGPNHLRMDDMSRRFAGLAQPVSSS